MKETTPGRISRDESCRGERSDGDCHRGERSDGDWRRGERSDGDCAGASEATGTWLVTPGCNDGRMRLAVRPPLKPMLAKAATAVPEQPTTANPCGRTSPNGTGSAPSCSATATRWCSARAAARIWPGTSPRWSRRCGRNCRRAASRRRTGGAPGDRRPDPAGLGARSPNGSTRPHSRVKLLAEQTPAQFVGFDLLALGDDDLTARAVRRTPQRLLDAVGGRTELSRHRGHPRQCHRAALVREFEGAGLDGVSPKGSTATICRTSGRW